MPDGATFIIREAPPTLFERISRAGWECAVVLTDEFRDRLTLRQLVEAEIAARRGPERIGTLDAGAMVALFVSVVEVRV